MAESWHTQRRKSPYLATVLARPRLQRYIDADEAAAVVDNLHTRALILRAPPDVELSSDPKDNPIPAAAIAGEAERIVSDDKRHMLALGAGAVSGGRTLSGWISAARRRR